MISTNPDFLIIDDSRLDCLISEKIIRNCYSEATYRTFTEAAAALKYIVNRPDTLAPPPPTIILLDIQMPVMNGFEFAAAFEDLAETTKSRYVIYMVSSSNNESDLMRIRNYPSIKRFFNKPLSKEIILEITDTSYTD